MNLTFSVFLPRVDTQVALQADHIISGARDQTNVPAIIDTNTEQDLTTQVGGNGTVPHSDPGQTESTWDDLCEFIPKSWDIK